MTSNPLQRVLTFRVDLWEVLLVGALVLAVTYRPEIPTTGERELASFRDAYGPEHFTENEEEWIIRDFFKDRRGGFFVDVGANHPQLYSKTYYLETRLAWSGIAVDPLEEFAGEYARIRPRTKFFPLFVSDRSDELARLYVISENTLVASSNRAFTSRFGAPDRIEEVPTVALSDLLDREGVTTIDFLSMDIELHEPEALAGLDIRRHRPALVCIEGLLAVRQPILEYFARNGYVLVGKYLRADQENLYFTPLGG